MCALRLRIITIVPNSLFELLFLENNYTYQHVHNCTFSTGNNNVGISAISSRLLVAK